MQSKLEKNKILHFSPVRKEHKIVELHCKSLEDLKVDDFEFTFSFFDDNTDLISSEILKNFKKRNKNTIIFSESDLSLDENYTGEQRWTSELYSRITKIKDFVIDYFLKSNYDFLFLSDADLIIHPETITNLHRSNKDFIAEVFWTHFIKRPTYFPNAWFDGPNGYSQKGDVIQLRDNKIIEVDYTGACTLLSRKILESNVRFKRIENLKKTFLGEDKHFCVRASSNDFKIFLNTESPAFHIYNNDLIKKGKEFIENNYDNSFLKEAWLNNEWENKLENYFNNLKLTFIKRLKNRVKGLLLSS